MAKKLAPVLEQWLQQHRPDTIEAQWEFALTVLSAAGRSVLQMTAVVWGKDVEMGEYGA